MKTMIFCDGACRGNPGPSSSGVVIFEENKKIFFSGEYEEKGTNNTAELKALYHALLLSKNYDDVVIKTDSQYSINCLTKWAYSWKAKDWKKANGPIKNLELIKIIHSLWLELKDNVEIVYVKGHAGIIGNELADDAANYGLDHKIKKLQNIINIFRLLN